MQLWSIDDDKTFGPVDAVDALAACFDQSAGKVERLHLLCVLCLMKADLPLTALI
jgi:hypothetical protein